MDPSNQQRWRHQNLGRRKLAWDGVLAAAFGMDWKTSISSKAVPIKQLRAHFQAEAFALIHTADPSILREERVRKKLKKDTFDC